MNLVASMIVKNEIGRYLQPCIRHLLSYCNAIVVLDDHSDDGTFEWLQGQGRVTVARNQGPAFYEHEGKARQELYHLTMEAKPTHVLAIDADEFVGDPSCVRQACASGVEVATLTLSEVWAADESNLSIRVDGLWRARTVPILYQPQPGWTIKDKALACGREPTQVVERYGRAKSAGSSILHFGWTRKSERIARAERYDVHDGGKYHQDAHLRSILWEEQQNRRLRLQSTFWPVELFEHAEEICAIANR